MRQIATWWGTILRRVIMRIRNLLIAGLWQSSKIALPVFFSFSLAAMMLVASLPGEWDVVYAKGKGERGGTGTATTTTGTGTGTGTGTAVGTGTGAGGTAAAADPDTTRIVICHKLGTPAEKTLEVPQVAYDQGHSKHGDTLGPCP